MYVLWIFIVETIALNRIELQQKNQDEKQKENFKEHI